VKYIVPPTSCTNNSSHLQHEVIHLLLNKTRTEGIRDYGTAGEDV